MSCNDKPFLERTDLVQTEPARILDGEKILITLDIYERDSNGSLVVPTTMTLTNLLVNAYSTNDFSIVLLTGTPSAADIMLGSVKQGVRIIYTLDSALLSGPGRYCLRFYYDENGGIESRQIPYFIDILTLTDPFSGC